MLDTTLESTAVKTNASAATIAPRKRVRVETTPASMIPASAQAARSNGAPAAGQSAPQVDYGKIVAECATRKSAIGQTFVGKQGKQHLFASACASVKSLLGMAKFMDDNKTPTRLDDVYVNGILDAMKEFWQSQANRLLNYGEIRSATFDKPTAEAVKSETGIVTGFKPRLNARIHAQKDCRDASESALMLEFCIAQQRKRVDYMQGIITPGGNQSSAGAGRSTREEIDAAKAKLALLESSKAGYVAQIAPVAPQS